MATRVSVLDGGGPKDSENTLNSFSTKRDNDVFWQIAAEMILCLNKQAMEAEKVNLTAPMVKASQFYIVQHFRWWRLYADTTWFGIKETMVTSDHLISKS